MSLVEILPDVQSLSRDDKLQLVQVLVKDLEQETCGLIQAGGTYPIRYAEQDHAAAGIMLQALVEHKARQ
jgi:hypothetical protein